MAISVVCSKCQARFRVSDKFAGQTGPCPKCKNPIVIPKPAAVTIHEPERPASSSASGRMPTAPIVFERAAPSPVTVTLVVAALLALFGGGIRRRTYLRHRRRACDPDLAAGSRSGGDGCADHSDRLRRCPRQGIAGLQRPVAGPAGARCSLVYAGLWLVRGTLITGELEIWQWTFVAPFFLFAGGLAAITCFDLDWEVGVGHYTLYVVLTALMRYLAGLSPPV